MQIGHLFAESSLFGDVYVVVKTLKELLEGLEMPTYFVKKGFQQSTVRVRGETCWSRASTPRYHQDLEREFATRIDFPKWTEVLSLH